MGFSDEVLAFAEKVSQRNKDIFKGSVGHLHHSITDGSEVTAAPGSPVDTGNLKASWQEAYPEEWLGRVTTGAEYAEGIEDGVGPHGPLTLRSEVGGFHSVALTRAAWVAVVEHERKKVVGG